jgi:hypothetical protein
MIWETFCAKVPACGYEWKSRSRWNFQGVSSFFMARAQFDRHGISDGDYGAIQYAKGVEKTPANFAPCRTCHLQGDFGCRLAPCNFLGARLDDTGVRNMAMHSTRSHGLYTYSARVDIDMPAPASGPRTLISHTS